MGSFIARHERGKALIMTAEQHGDDVEIQQLAPQPIVSIRATIPVAALGEHYGERMQALSDYLRRHGVQPAGPPFVRYHTFNETETDVEFGLPVGEPGPGEGRIVSGALPGGPALVVTHVGAHDKLGNAYARLRAGLQARDREPDGPLWEVYYWMDPSQDAGPSSLPDPSSLRTQLVQPITDLEPH